MKFLQRLFLVGLALILACVSAITATVGYDNLVNPETSAFTRPEAFGICALGAASLGCIFLIQRILKNTYTDD